MQDKGKAIERSKTEIQHDKCQELVRRRRSAIERARQEEDKSLRNWRRGDRTQGAKELFIYDKF